MSHPLPDPGRRTTITIGLILATIMTAVASTIANVVLPQIRASTGAAQDQISWVLTSFILAGVVVTPAIGWLEQTFGRRLVLLASLVGFTICSALCGIADSIFEMVLFRVLQGSFAAVFVPMSQAILLDINPPEHHGRAMSVWGMGAVLGPIIGPILGGWLSDNLSWRWVFFLNIPLAVVAFLLLAAAMPAHTTPENKKRFDSFGFMALTLFVVSLQVILDRGPGREWFASTEIWIELALCLLGLWVFIVHTFMGEKTIVDRRILMDSNFLVAAVMIFFIGIVMFAGMAVLPTLLQQLLGYPVMHTGLIQAPRGVGTLISMFIVGRLVGKVDSRLIVFVGLALTGWSYLEMTRFSLDMDEHLVLISGLLQGLGLGLIFVPLSALAFTTIQPQMRTEAASVFTLIRNIGSSIGISMVGALQIFNAKITQSTLAEHATPDSPNVIASLPSAIDLTTAPGQAMMGGIIRREGSMVAYIDSFHLLMWLCLIVVPLIFLMRTRKAKANA